jgi:hypothetical protein
MVSFMAASEEPSQDPFNHDRATTTVQPRVVDHDPFRPAQQRREGIKVPDILAAEFGPLTLLFCAEW